jgi:hypothetical protein
MKVLLQETMNVLIPLKELWADIDLDFNFKCHSIYNTPRLQHSPPLCVLLPPLPISVNVAGAALHQSFCILHVL